MRLLNHILQVAFSISRLHTCSNRQLAAALQQPRVRAALAEFRDNPEAASTKYEGDQEITQALDLLEKSLSIDVPG